MPKIVTDTCPVEEWDGNRDYRKGAKCTRAGEVWECVAAHGVYNATLIPGGFTPFFWAKSKKAPKARAVRKIAAEFGMDFVDV